MNKTIEIFYYYTEFGFGLRIPSLNNRVIIKDYEMRLPYDMSNHIMTQAINDLQIDIEDELDPVNIFFKRTRANGSFLKSRVKNDWFN